MSPEYRAALLAARQRMGALDLRTARSIQQAVADWATALARWLASRPTDAARTAQAAMQEVVRRTAVEMVGRIRKAALTNRDLMFADTLELWQRAGIRVAERRDVPNALLGAMRRPPLTILQAQALRPGASTWHTLIAGHGENAAGEVQQIIRRALLEGVSPPELAQRLRRYVVGSETFAGAFRRVQTATGDVWKIDLREIPKAQQGQAQQMRSNAERIAVTEIHAARSDAEVLHFLHDPLIAAIQWTLSPDRGANNPPAPPDVCNVLATVDLYGLGSGVWPLHKVPPLPHPRDRCQRNPVERAVSQAGDPKPTPDRVLAPGDVAVPRAGDLTKLAHQRVLEQFERLIAMTEETSGAYLTAMASTAQGRALAGLVRP